ncbi:MAG: ferrous iron transport protein A [Candidatus Glassbacteria bacterium]|nr:ferrous iron transport protein A [Candidatus Glassbacteria bacterium]
MTLSNIGPGKVVKMVSVEGGLNLRSRLAAMGLIPGVEIEVLRSSSTGPFIVVVKGTRLVLGRGMAHKIMVS